MPLRLKSRAVRDHEQAVIDSMKGDPEFAAAYVNAVMSDGDEQELLLALRRLAEAGGGISSLAGRAGLNPTTLYRTLSKDGNPELRSLNAMLRALGLRLAVQPLGS